MRSCRLLRRRLALTTILTVAPFLGYGRAVQAACGPNPAAPVFLCEGQETTTLQILNTPNATVSTAPDFEVITTTGDGITLTGAGHIRFTDEIGTVIEGAEDGLEVRSTGDGGETPGAVTITTNGNVTGTNRGINARNAGSGSLEINANGKVTAMAGTGIRARTSENGENLTITTGVGSEIKAGMDEDYNGGDAIWASNYGKGYLDITVNGDVSSERYHGIEAYNGVNGSDLKITVGAESTVYGNFFGIDAGNYGAGALDITVLGKVISPNNAVVAFNRAEDSVLKITTGVGSVISGDYRGIMAKNYGSGDLEITVDGEVTGRVGRGIYTSSYGIGNITIKVGSTGLAQGGASGVYASSIDGREVFITNEGTVRNLSGKTDDLAIEVVYGAAKVDNNGKLDGTVLFDEYDDTLNNVGSWNMAKGESNFGAGTDVVNNSGKLIAADDAETGEHTKVEGLETFNNSDVISLADGQVGDSLEMTGLTEFAGKGGRLMVDANLVEGGTSDMLIIDSEVSGVTTVSVTAIGVTGINRDGIAVIEVGGEAKAGDFVLEGGVLNVGFFAWGLRPDGNIYELYTMGPSVGSYEFAAGITGAQDLWHQSVGTLLQRQDDLRATVAGLQVMPVADLSEPVAPASVGKVVPGFWFKALGAYLDRDANQGDVILDRTQTVFGGLAGFDAGIDTGNPGETLLFGLFGGYLTSDLRFKSTDSDWDYEGPSVGAYATYLNDAFHADLTIKADFLSIDIDADDLAPGSGEADTDGFNIGGQLDTGYRIGLDRAFYVEPQASLAVLHTEIEDIDDIFGGAVEFDDETSVRGRLGLRLGREVTSSNDVVYSTDVTASLWQEFNGSNDATVLAPDFTAAGVSDDTDSTFGDISIGFGVRSLEGWSSFLRGNWQFAEHFDALSAQTGVRYAW